MFRISRDPNEKNDLLAKADATGEAPQTRRRMTELVRGGRQATPPFDTPVHERTPLDEETLERLRSLGYVD